MNAADKTVLNTVILKQRSFIFYIFYWREKFLTALCNSNIKPVGTQFEPRKPQSNLKGPKREIFGFGIFAQIRPIWIG